MLDSNGAMTPCSGGGLDGGSIPTSVSAHYEPNELLYHRATGSIRLLSGESGTPVCRGGTGHVVQGKQGILCHSTEGKGDNVQ